MLLDVDRGEHVVFDQTLRDDDGVLEVVALPWHERHQQVPTQGELTGLGGRAVGEHVAHLDLVTLADQWLVVHACALVGALELVQGEGVLLVGGGLLDDDLVTRHLDHFTSHR